MISNKLELSPQSQSPDIGVIFQKGIPLTVAEFGLDLKAAAAQLGMTTTFARDALFGLFMVTEAVSGIYNVNIEFKDGTSFVFPFPAWAWIPCVGQKILAAGTTATSIVVLAGQ